MNIKPDSEFDALYARDGEKVTARSATAREIAEYWFAQGKVVGIDRGLASMVALTEDLNEIVSPSGARVL